MRHPRLVLCVALALELLIVSIGHAQSEPHTPTAGLSGVWLLDGGTATFSAEAPPPMTAWGAERYAANKPTVGRDAVLDANDPTLDCLPPGIPYILTIPTPFEIVELEDQLLQIFEYDHSIRRIYTDGRQHPDDLHLTGMYQWMGHSVGHWDGDVLVVETVGFNDKTWLDRSGRPHSNELRVLERLRRTGQDTLVVEVTVEDPKAFTRPWRGRMVFRAKAGWDLFEHICVSEHSGSTEYAEYKNRAWQPSD